jgi:hypothetical protein
MRDGSTILGSLKLKSGKIGAGGFCTGISAANDGTLMIRTDTFNSYVLPAGGSTWQLQLKPGINIAGSAIDMFYTPDGSAASPWGQVGCYAAAIAPSNPNVRYMVSMGFVYATQDGGATWTKTNLAQKTGCAPNESSRMTGQPLAVDPQNPAVCIAALPTGAFITSDYGANWTAISTASVPAPASGKRSIVAFDPSSSVVGGKKQGIYIFVNGTGLKHSTDGGATWSSVTAPTNSPTAASHMKIGSNGYVYLGGDGAAGTARFRRWNGSAWLEPTGIVCKSMAVSPHNAGHVYICGDGGGLDFSSDYGATWALGGGSFSVDDRVATNIGWHAATKENYMTNGDLIFDPTVNRLWIAEGIGVWKMDSPPTSMTFASHFTWTEWSSGIENMVTGTINCAPDGGVGYACQDRGVFIRPPGTVGVTYPSGHGEDYNDAIYFSQSCDQAPEDNAFWAGTFYSGSRCTGFTTDRGLTPWTARNALLSTSGGIGGGQIVVLSKDVWLQVQVAVTPIATGGAKNRVYLTTDRGLTWSAITIGDNSCIVGQYSYNHNRRVLVKDRFTAGRAYFYNVADVDNPSSAGSVACKGCWRIDVNLTTFAVTVTRMSSSYIIGGGSDAFHGKLTQGGSANEWYWCGGDNALGLWRSTDGMATWSEVTGTDDQGAGTHFAEVFAVGVGKALATSSYKTIAVVGWRMNTPANASNATGYGLWESTDNGATWKLAAQFMGGIFDLVCDMVGDPTKYGRFFIGYGGTGMWMQTYDYQMAMQ